MQFAAPKSPNNSPNPVAVELIEAERHGSATGGGGADGGGDSGIEKTTKSRRRPKKETSPLASDEEDAAAKWAAEAFVGATAADVRFG